MSARNCAVGSSFSSLCRSSSCVRSGRAEGAVRAQVLLTVGASGLVEPRRGKQPERPAANSAFNTREGRMPDPGIEVR